MAKNRILVVDDEQHFRDWLCQTLKRRNYAVEACEDGQTALALLEDGQQYDVIVTDVRMPKMSGLQLLRTVHERFPGIDVVIMTQYGSVPEAVAALKDGAIDFLEKPFPQETLLLRVQKAFEARKLKLENYQLKRELGTKFQFNNILRQSPKMLEVLEQLEMVVPTRATVLIQGESGTGKELIARALHENSPRRNGPFVKINCAAMPETLMESELFGHEKGAFTGAIKTVEGRFALAHGGTLLLDEVSEMSTAMQAKLLRVLQEREFEKLGGRETIKIDVRIVATTNRDLKRAIADGDFREDLFHRLNVCPIKVSPLRDRREDIPVLASHFIAHYSSEYAKDIQSIDEAAMEQLLNYEWPGNVRELQHKIERAVIMCDDQHVRPKHLYLDGIETTTTTETMFTLDAQTTATLAEIEKAAIFRALRVHENNRTKTAESLGISIRTLRNKLREYREEGISVD
ncbi:MAG: sigma-54-dependent Fis family transcriptional regulator [bacterium]|nr:sigma-54-dependent Fis family transcriptional regulator [bacterium]